MKKYIQLMFLSLGLMQAMQADAPQTIVFNGSLDELWISPIFDCSGGTVIGEVSIHTQANAWQAIQNCLEKAKRNFKIASINNKERPSKQTRKPIR